MTTLASQDVCRPPLLLQRPPVSFSKKLVSLPFLSSFPQHNQRTVVQSASCLQTAKTQPISASSARRRRHRKSDILISFFPEGQLEASALTSVFPEGSASASAPASTEGQPDASVPALAYPEGFADVSVSASMDQQLITLFQTPVSTVVGQPSPSPSSSSAPASAEGQPDISASASASTEGSAGTSALVSAVGWLQLLSPLRIILTSHQPPLLSPDQPSSPLPFPEKPSSPLSSFADQPPPSSSPSSSTPPSQHKRHR
ncbi:hypothetical protein ILYODFUR_022395 [Ilyodon furcidens]|uniref:Uncharacterized protein n=1 Tax=Ilyodon furcidens TaxID=33524 RepID=A0ABV0UA67_9TELE